jgi:hypothetical protein
MVDKKISDEGSSLLPPGKSVHVADEAESVLMAEPIHGVSRPVDDVRIEGLPALILETNKILCQNMRKLPKNSFLLKPCVL